MVSRLLLTLSVLFGMVAAALGLLAEPRQVQAENKWCLPWAALGCNCPYFNNEPIPGTTQPVTGCFQLNGPPIFQCQSNETNSCVVTQSICIGFFYHGGQCGGGSCFGGTKDENIIMSQNRANCRSE